MSKRNGILAALGLNVRRQREAKQFTQEKLAEKAGLDATYISGIERGLRNPGIKNIAKLAKPDATASIVNEIEKLIIAKAADKDQPEHGEQLYYKAKGDNQPIDTSRLQPVMVKR